MSYTNQNSLSRNKTLFYICNLGRIYFHVLNLIHLLSDIADEDIHNSVINSSQVTKCNNNVIKSRVEFSKKYCEPVHRHGPPLHQERYDKWRHYLGRVVARTHGLRFVANDIPNASGLPPNVIPRDQVQQTHQRQQEREGSCCNYHVH